MIAGTIVTQSRAIGWTRSSFATQAPEITSDFVDVTNSYDSISQEAPVNPLALLVASLRWHLSSCLAPEAHFEKHASRGGSQAVSSLTLTELVHLEVQTVSR